MENANGETIKMKSKCIKCGAIKEIACTVDGNPWCDECFDKALGAMPFGNKRGGVKNNGEDAQTDLSNDASGTFLPVINASCPFWEKDDEEMRGDEE